MTKCIHGLNRTECEVCKHLNKLVNRTQTSIKKKNVATLSIGLETNNINEARKYLNSNMNNAVGGPGSGFNYTGDQNVPITIFMRSAAQAIIHKPTKSSVERMRKTAQKALLNSYAA